MSKIEQLLKKLCPNGVEYKKLGELGDFYTGLSGKCKDDFKDGNAKFVTYMNVYSNPGLKVDIEDRVKIAAGERQNTLEKGDVLFTGSSETPEECGMSSVLLDDPKEPMYLNSFCFGFRMLDKERFEPGFLKHLFRSSELRKQITKTANGVTRFNVSKVKMAKVSIPVPPLEIQREVVEVLDKFALLTAELTAELEKRKKQYEHYRDKLLNFTGGGTFEWLTLGGIVEVLRGKRLTKSMLSSEYQYPVFHGGLDPLGYFNKANRPSETVMIINVGASAGTVGYCEKEFWSSDGCFCLSHTDVVKSKFLYYLLQGREGELKSRVRVAGIPTLDRQNVENMRIPLPPLAEQERIVKILDRFDKLCNDLTSGLPAEIAARKKQYEYYRDKLLSFKRAG